MAVNFREKSQEKPYNVNPPLALALNTRVGLMAALMYDGETHPKDLEALADKALRLERAVDSVCKAAKERDKNA